MKRAERYLSHAGLCTRGTKCPREGPAAQNRTDRQTEVGISAAPKAQAERLNLVFIMVALKCYERRFHYVHGTGSNL